MGLFSRKKGPSPEEEAAMEANKALLDKFQMTRAWGIKKHPDAIQFIYDENMKAFVVVKGPEDTFKERNPYVIGFDEVTDVWLEVDEWWTEDGGKWDVGRGYGVLLQERYSKVFWRYDFYLNIETTHPFAEKIRYKMNYNTNILKVPGTHLFVHRGLELDKKNYKRTEIKKEVERLEEFAEKIKEGLGKEKVFDILTHQRPDTITGRLEKDFTDEWYVSRIENVVGHLKRAYRISKLLGK